MTFQKIPSDKNQKQSNKESTQLISRPGQTLDQIGVNTLRQRRNLSGQANIVVCKLSACTRLGFWRFLLDGHTTFP